VKAEIEKKINEYKQKFQAASESRAKLIDQREKVDASIRQAEAVLIEVRGSINALESLRSLIVESPITKSSDSPPGTVISKTSRVPAPRAQDLAEEVPAPQMRYSKEEVDAIVAEARAKGLVSSSKSQPRPNGRAATATPDASEVIRKLKDEEASPESESGKQSSGMRNQTVLIIDQGSGDNGNEGDE